MTPEPNGLAFLAPVQPSMSSHCRSTPYVQSHRKLLEASPLSIQLSGKAKDSEFSTFVFIEGVQTIVAKSNQRHTQKRHRGRKGRMRAVCRQGDLRIPRLVQMTPGLMRGLCAAALTAKMAPFAASSSAVTISCFPLFLPTFSSEQVQPPTTRRAVQMQKELVIVCTAQGSLALVQTLFGDILGGSIGIVVATVGLCSTMPRGVRLLPTYITSTFLNGSLSLLAVVERIPFMPWPLLSLSQPVVVNAVHLVILAQPALAFFGALVSYQYLKEIRAVSAERVLSGETDIQTGGGTGLQEDSEARDGSFTFVPFAGTPHKLTEDHTKEQAKVP